MESSRMDGGRLHFDELGDAGRDADGDDEFSAADEPEKGGRGRGRTRKREEDPEVKKGLLEDALRSRFVFSILTTPEYSVANFSCILAFRLSLRSVHTAKVNLQLSHTLR